VVVVQLEGKPAKSGRGSEECPEKGASVDESPVSAADARDKVARLVRGNAVAIANKLIEVATQEGQLGHVKFLFEMAGIHPAGLEEATSKPEESVICSWLKELGMPTGTQDDKNVERQEDGRLRKDTLE
jgi:hypothetical protein